MVLDYYKLREHPFGVTPDSRYLFLSSTHREALASLLYGVDAGCGFLALIATPGLGKTTLLFHAMNQLREKALTVFLFQTVCTPMDLLRALLTGLGVQDTQGTLIQMQLRLKEALVEQARRGKRVVVVIDEAQNLDDSVLELIRMLSNFETSREKLIQIILSGQPQLAEKIGSPDLEQLRQRVSIFACLKPFSREDTQLYIDHRLRIAGYNFDAPLFTRDALALIADYSDGIPRNINNLCFNSLSLACALQKKLIDSDIVREVIADLDLERFRKKTTIAARPEEKGSQAVPAFLSVAGTPSMFAGWIPKLALVIAVILALGAAVFATSRWGGHKAAVHTENAAPRPSAAPTPAPAPVNAHQPVAPAEAAGQAASVVPPQVVPDSPSSTNAEQSAEGVAPESAISVTPGKTLLGICVDSFGKCNPELMQEIRKLNPGLNNPDHIESGQKIRLPAPGAIAEQPGKASLSERDTQ
jgi:general secretion pathway protein A